MRSFLVLGILAVVTAPAFAASKTVAVVNFHDKTGKYGSMAAKVHGALAGKGVSLVSQSKISKELQRRGKNAASALSVDDAVAVGKAVGADYVVTGTVSTPSKNTIVVANLIQVSSKSTKSSAVEKIEKDKDAYTLASKIAGKLAASLKSLAYVLSGIF